jgi:hypothetical protein
MSFQNSVDETSPCSKYWWTNMLYINNMYPNQFSANAEGGLGCMSWFVVCRSMRVSVSYSLQDLVSCQ